jgi:hypothetical protein
LKNLIQPPAEQVLFRSSNLHHIEGQGKFSELFFRDSDSCVLAIATEFAKRDLKASARLLLETRLAHLSEIMLGAGCDHANQ